MKNPGHTTALNQRLIEFNSGDLEARDEIIALTCERLRLRTRQMLRSFPNVSRWSQTDDVLQNAMIRLYKSLAQVKPESPKQFYGLAATHIRRELIDLARHFHGAEGIGGNHDTHDGEPIRQLADASYRPETIESWAEFHSAVDQLPDEQQAVVGLVWYEGMSQPAASQVLGISLATLKRRWQAARLKLSEQLKSHWVD